MKPRPGDIVYVRAVVNGEGENMDGNKCVTVQTVDKFGKKFCADAVVYVEHESIVTAQDMRNAIRRQS